MPVMEYALTKHFCAKLELITYGNGYHHNAAVSLYKNCGINQFREFCPDRVEENGQSIKNQNVKNHLTILFDSVWTKFTELIYTTVFVTMKQQHCGDFHFHR